MHDVSVYLGRWGGGDVPTERMHFVNVFFVVCLDKAENTQLVQD